MIYLGRGIYNLSTAAKILKINSRKMSRWINGYSYKKNMECRLIEPLFSTEFDYNSDELAISFLDLTELLFINTFIEHGISIQKIRKAAINASKILNTSHPFAL
jgi:hypothetical protein